MKIKLLLALIYCNMTLLVNVKLGHNIYGTKTAHHAIIIIPYV